MKDEVRIEQAGRTYPPGPLPLTGRGCPRREGGAHDGKGVPTTGRGCPRREGGEDHRRLHGFCFSVSLAGAVYNSWALGLEPGPCAAAVGMSYQLSYFVYSLIFLGVWIVLFALRSD